VVAVRPLQIEELAEVLAVDFDDAEEIPKLNASWRWENQEQALLSSCSSLIAIVDVGDSRVVQFSHFSVKEFLTSPRLSTSSRDVSRYYVALELAHVVLAQACLGVLLSLDGRVIAGDIGSRSPLAGYASQYWVGHARFENASSRVGKAMEYLFDPDKPQFAAWLQLYDIDNMLTTSPLSMFKVSKRSGATPLYYAVRCGFQDLAKHLIDRHPQHVNSNGGSLVTPIVAALAGGYFQLSQLLFERGADVDVRGHNEHTSLWVVSQRGHLEIAQWLLSRSADPNSRSKEGRWTPLHSAAYGGQPEVARILLQHNADKNAQDRMGLTPLHFASEYGRPRVSRLLLEHGADVDARDEHRSTPLHLAIQYRKLEVVRLLIEHGANVDAQDDEGKTALQLALAEGHHEISKLLSDHGSKSEVT
jgi:ankyrin repeat protein